MKLIGGEFLAGQLAGPDRRAKLVFNGVGAIFFPASQQHREQKAPGISYEDDSAGNALAAMLSPGKIEIRSHREFGGERVAGIVSVLMELPELAALRTWRVVYRGQDLNGRHEQSGG